jgi:hypothetical protein
VKRLILKLQRTLVAIILVVIGGGLIAAASTFYISYLVGNFGDCTAILRRSIPSPDGSKYIVIFGMECGTTVGFNTQVSIAPTGAEFSYKKNPPFFVVSEKYEVAARWLRDDAIEVLVPSGARVLKEQESIGGIKIGYR